VGDFAGFDVSVVPLSKIVLKDKRSKALKTEVFKAFERLY
jgi:hypothetical protein